MNILYGILQSAFESLLTSRCEKKISVLHQQNYVWQRGSFLQGHWPLIAPTSSVINDAQINDYLAANPYLSGGSFDEQL
jgi:hypothetical protein